MYSYDKPVRRLEREEIKRIAGEVLDALGVADAGLDGEEMALFRTEIQKRRAAKKKEKVGG